MSCIIGLHSYFAVQGCGEDPCGGVANHLQVRPLPVLANKSCQGGLGGLTKQCGTGLVKALLFQTSTSHVERETGSYANTVCIYPEED